MNLNNYKDYFSNGTRYLSALTGEKIRVNGNPKFVTQEGGDIYIENTNSSAYIYCMGEWCTIIDDNGLTVNYEIY